LVIIPTYNERDNVLHIIDAVLRLSPSFDVLVVDDGSPDGTADLVKSRIKDFPQQIYLLERKGKLGLGTAYITGFKWGLSKGYSHLCEMDADFSHPPEDLIRLYDACYHGADVAVGSRYVSGGKLKNWPYDRIFLSKGASLYVRLITGMPVMDPTAGFVCYRREVLETIDLDKIKFIGYAFQIEMKFAARQNNFKMVEVPITFTDRVMGNSKMSGGIVKEAIIGVLKMKWKGIKGYYKN
jgi:dolichol-phosphate mannosyltransferase